MKRIIKNDFDRWLIRNLSYAFLIGVCVIGVCVIAAYILSNYFKIP